jgi:hypothetical protein
MLKSSNCQMNHGQGFFHINLDSGDVVKQKIVYLDQNVWISLLREKEGQATQKSESLWKLFSRHL